MQICLIRLLVFIYSEQFANVPWNGKLSSIFTMKNGVRQGAILSAIAYCFYVEDLFATLKTYRALAVTDIASLCRARCSCASC